MDGGPVEERSWVVTHAPGHDQSWIHSGGTLDFGLRAVWKLDSNGARVEVGRSVSWYPGKWETMVLWIRVDISEGGLHIAWTQEWGRMGHWGWYRLLAGAPGAWECKEHKGAGYSVQAIVIVKRTSQDQLPGLDLFGDKDPVSLPCSKSTWRLSWWVPRVCSLPLCPSPSLACSAGQETLKLFCAPALPPPLITPLSAWAQRCQVW